MGGSAAAAVMFGLVALALAWVWRVRAGRRRNARIEHLNRRLRLVVRHEIARNAIADLHRVKSVPERTEADALAVRAELRQRVEELNQRITNYRKTPRPVQTPRGAAHPRPAALQPVSAQS